ncbi:MAG TPA: succinate dehydrogenase, cytochrome b subunit [Afifellaceae bacterium]|nr:succinate dehydrogenase, cytochrome b subunit [Afifellaceae bacterium]
MSALTRQHRGAGYYAFLAHRLSGLALAVFLPLHFLMLGLALEGAERLDGYLVYADMPLVKAAEWGLVVLLTIHMTFGLRVLAIEFGDWRGFRYGWLGAGLGGAVAVGAAFVLVLL